MTIRTAAVFCLAATASLISGTALAQQVVFDNWNGDACALTDRAGFQLDQPMHITDIALKYHWAEREDSARFEVFVNGESLGGGDLTRGTCDPYQPKWCEANATLDTDLGPGYVEVRTERGMVCRNEVSHDVGFIRAEGGPTDEPPPSGPDDPN